jgi:hypothetical protein
MPDISGLELLSQLPKGMATIMLSVRQPGAGRAGAERRRARLPVETLQPG